MKNQLPPIESEDEIGLLLHTSAAMLYRDADPRRFLAWIADAGPTLAPGLAAGVDPRTGSTSLFFRSFGVQLYNAMPLREHGYHLNPLPVPGRNEACQCGSGNKYKHCCLRLQHGMQPFANYNMLRHVLDAHPKSALATLADTAVNMDMVVDTAWQWRQEGQTGRVIALLEPWFAPGRKLTIKLAGAFDALMDAYLRNNQPRKREHLLDLLLDSGIRELRATALQRKTTMLADAGRTKEAWHTFQLAQREDPDDPALSHLEITLLLSARETERARERARYWMLRLQKRGEASPELLQFLRAVAEDPYDAMAGIGTAMKPGLKELLALLAAAPALACHYRIERDAGSEGLLQPEQNLARVEQHWSEVFPRVEPFLTSTQIDDELMWENPWPWLAFLEAESLAWQSLQVLDDLVLAVEVLQLPGVGETLLPQLLARGQALLGAALATVQESAETTCTLPWGFMENRPALRLLAHAVFNAWQQQGPGSADAIVLAETLLRLNPDDNHGIRDELSRLYLESGDAGAVVALCARYDEDLMIGMTLNHVLALHRLSRSGEALALLATRTRQVRTAITMLLAADPKMPRMSADGGYIAGGKDEAWIYRQQHFALWREHGALDWLRKAWGSVKAKR